MPSPPSPQLGPHNLPSEVLLAANLTLERKAQAVMAMDLRGISSATDFFVLGTGNSDIQVRAIAEHVIEELKKSDVRPDHVEGLEAGYWVLIDYIDFVVHVFHHTARAFYQLEVLWGDAPSLSLEE
jgi:ribosome-associated protein